MVNWSVSDSYPFLLLTFSSVNFGKDCAGRMQLEVIFSLQN